MTTFLQLHLLTVYPPANLNRDDTGRPKTAGFGGAERLRISSQSLKRAFRTSAVFTELLDGHVGRRSARFGTALAERLIARGVPPETAVALARKALETDRLAALKKETGTAETEQLAHLSPEEFARLEELARVIAETGSVPEGATLILSNAHKAADIAMFGRMLADRPEFNRDAAVQVAHALTTHRVTVEDDFFTAVDDLKAADRAQDRGAGFVGVHEFGSGVFYLYLCINQDLLLANLQGDTALGAAATEALLRAAATVAPSGKQNSFASRAYASYILVEKGPQQPRTLAAAFLKPVSDADYLARSIAELETCRDRMDAAYGPCAEARAVMNVPAGEGSLDALVRFAAEPAHA